MSLGVLYVNGIIFLQGLKYLLRWFGICLRKNFPRNQAMADGDAPSAEVKAAIDVIPAPSGVPSTADKATEEAGRELGYRAKAQIVDWRDRFAELIMFLTQVWIAFVIVVTAVQIFLKDKDKIGLSEKEYLGLLGASTASLLGLAYILAKFLFPEKGSTEEMRRD